MSAILGAMGANVLLQLGMPIALAISAIVGWRMMKRGEAKEQEKPLWRDDSLDDWHREREEAAEQVRAERSDTKPKTNKPE